MTTLTLEIDEQTLDEARRRAAAQGRTVEDLVQAYVQQLAAAKPTARTPSGRTSIIGLFADDAAILDQIAEEAMRGRERRNAALIDGSPSGDRLQGP